MEDPEEKGVGGIADDEEIVEFPAVGGHCYRCDLALVCVTGWIWRRVGGKTLIDDHGIEGEGSQAEDETTRQNGGASFEIVSTWSI